jgi:hypothetical protein
VTETDRQRDADTVREGGEREEGRTWVVGYLGFLPPPTRANKLHLTKEWQGQGQREKGR